ncbi:MAG: DUF58 domain-containing protein [Planctomycetota bacterium]|nr:DUF58 domain-containing protein [Planctomycetota bacterium]MDI6787528.1 DUF58 domain-containing protein [Planctomycetota bacterium]
MSKWVKLFGGMNRESQEEQQSPFTSHFIRKLERLRFVIRKFLFSGTVGEMAMKQQGGRIDFAGHRNYSVGDEPRYIDWNAFARLERLYTKEFAREENIPLYIMLDISNSMLFPALRNKASTTKLAYTMQLALAIGYVGLVAGQPVRLFAFPRIRDGDDGLFLSPVFSSDKQLLKMMEHLIKVNRIVIGGRQTDKTTPSSLFSALTEFERRRERRGLLILISDLFENNHSDIHQSRIVLERLVARRFLINIMQVSSENEGYPSVIGLYKLRDSETGEEKDVRIEPQIISTYQKKLLAFSEEWYNFSRKHNGKYFFINTSTSVEDTVLRLLRKGGMLR